MKLSIKMAIASLFIAGLFIAGCGETTPVKKVNLAALLNGTYVYSGPVPGGVSMTVSLKFDNASRTFKYTETGGMANRSYSGNYVILGNQVVFTNGTSKQTSKHIVSETSNGISLKCIENNNTISFGMQPLQGFTLEFFKQ